MAKKPEHLHLYKKINLSQTRGKDYPVYKCMKPDCSHYLPIILAEGKLCECNRCGEPMVITRHTLTCMSGSKPMAKPHCPNCTKSKKRDNIKELADFLAGTKT